MGYFQVRYDSRVVNYDRRGFIRLATGANIPKRNGNIAALRLDVTNHTTSYNQSECFISALQSIEKISYLTTCLISHW